MICTTSGVLNDKPDWIERTPLSRLIAKNTEKFQKTYRTLQKDFKKNPGHVCIASACYVMYGIYYIQWSMR